MSDINGVVAGCAGCGNTGQDYAKMIEAKELLTEAVNIIADQSHNYFKVICLEEWAKEVQEFLNE